MKITAIAALTCVLAVFLAIVLVPGGTARAYDALSPEMISGPEDAPGKCEQVCAPLGGWNGTWAHRIDYQEQQISICGCNKRPALPDCRPATKRVEKSHERGSDQPADCVRPACPGCSTEGSE